MFVEYSITFVCINVYLKLEKEEKEGDEEYGVVDWVIQGVLVDEYCLNYNNIVWKKRSEILNKSRIYFSLRISLGHVTSIPLTLRNLPDIWDLFNWYNSEPKGPIL